MWKSCFCRSGMNLPLRSRTLTGTETSVVSMRTTSTCSWLPPIEGGFSGERSDSALLLFGSGFSTEAEGEGEGFGAVCPTRWGRACGATACAVVINSDKSRMKVIFFMAVTLDEAFATAPGTLKRGEYVSA